MNAHIPLRDLYVKTEFTQDEFKQLAISLYGEIENWQFRCPVCGHSANLTDYEKAGAPEGAVGFSCIGRYLPNPKIAFERWGCGPCSYTGGGLLQYSPNKITFNDDVTFLFALADQPIVTEPFERPITWPDWNLQVKLGNGRLDDGTFHRAISVAKMLLIAGRWPDHEKTVITLNSAYDMHYRLDQHPHKFTVGAPIYESIPYAVFDLKEGIDFIIRTSATFKSWRLGTK